MNLAEYTKILAKAPINYKVKPFSEVSSILWREQLIMFHKDNIPIIYDNGEWQELNVEEEVA